MWMIASIAVRSLKRLHNETGSLSANRAMSTARDCFAPHKIIK